MPVGAAAGIVGSKQAAARREHMKEHNSPAQGNLVHAKSMFLRSKTNSVAKSAAAMREMKMFNKLSRQTLSIIKMPSEDDWVKASILQKRVVTSDIFWQEKKIVLTRDIVAIGIPGTQSCVEHIPLDEIDAVEMIGHDVDHANVTPLAAKTTGGSFHHRSSRSNSAYSQDRTGSSRLRGHSFSDHHHTPSGPPSRVMSRMGSNTDARAPSPSGFPEKHTPATTAQTFTQRLLGGWATSKDSTDHDGQGQTHHPGSALPKFSLLHGHKPLTADETFITFEISTKDGGHNCGRGYIFRAETSADCKEWVDTILAMRKECVDRKNGIGAKTLPERARDALKALYDTHTMQTLLTLVIVANFVVSIVGAQMVPEDDTAAFSTLETIDFVFTALFVLELCINMGGHWFWPFWHDGWNIFDFAIVAVSIASIPLQNSAGFKVLRLMRVFRVVRLFRFLASLRIIINALTASILPVANAFGVLALVTMVYAIIGVNLFKDTTTHQFGNFASSLFTMFQVLTADGWATTIVRPMLEHHGDTTTVSVFFVSYILIVGTFLINVVIAVLLDEFVGAVQEDKMHIYREKEAAKRESYKKHAGALDPLLETLVHFNTSRDLSDRIKEIFQVMDEDMNGRLSISELRQGLRRLNTHHQVHLSREDFQLITEGGLLCDDEGTLDLKQFEAILRAQLASFVQRHVAHMMIDAEESEAENAPVLFALKQIILLLADSSGILGINGFKREDTFSSSSRSFNADPGLAGTETRIAKRLERIEESMEAKFNTLASSLCKAFDKVGIQVDVPDFTSSKPKDEFVRTASAASQQGQGGEHPDAARGRAEEGSSIPLRRGSDDDRVIGWYELGKRLPSNRGPPPPDVEESRQEEQSASSLNEDEETLVVRRDASSGADSLQDEEERNGSGRRGLSPRNKTGRRTSTTRTIQPPPEIDFPSASSKMSTLARQRTVSFGTKPGVGSVRLSEESAPDANDRGGGGGGGGGEVIWDEGGTVRADLFLASDADQANPNGHGNGDVGITPAQRRGEAGAGVGQRPSLRRAGSRDWSWRVEDGLRGFQGGLEDGGGEGPGESRFAAGTSLPPAPQAPALIRGVGERDA